MVLSIKKPRESNLELLRIFAMMAIIAHHSVVNSGVTLLFDYVHPNFQTYFLTIWGLWGKTAINSFILISGYFLCTGRLTVSRYLKLLIEVYFYRLIILSIFVLCKYEPITLKIIFQALFGPLLSINQGFTASFLVFYAFVPFYNKLIHSLDKKQHLVLLVGLLTMFTIASTFFNASTTNEPFWYMTLYFIAAY